MFNFLRGLTARRTRTVYTGAAGSGKSSGRGRRNSVRLSLERLEDRLNPALINITPADQLMIELINQARANPAAEAAHYGIDLNQGLTPGTISAAPMAPLAPQQALINAALLHSSDMYNRNYFNHVTPEGLHSWDRAMAQGYPTNYVGENIAWTTYNTSVNTQEQVVQALAQNYFLSPDHRQNMLNPTFDEIGSGMLFAQSPYQSATAPGLGVAISTEDFGYRAGLVNLTGVAYTDAVVPNNFYDIGEGLGGVTITATDQFGQVFATTTASAGGYALPVVSGVYTVTASGGGLTAPVTFTNVVVGTLNVKVDFIPGHSGTNAPPQLAALADQTLNRGQTLYVALQASDPNGDTLTYSTTITGSNPLYDLNHQLQLTQKNNTYFLDFLGQGEKWLWSQTQNQWYMILPDGSFYKWTGGTFQQSIFVRSVDPAAFNDPTLFASAIPPTSAPGVITAINSTMLSVTPPAGFAGSFHVTVNVSDGHSSVSQTFLVTVRNHAPQLADISDQQMSRQGTLAITINGTDADGDALTYTATVSAYSLAYDLDQQLQLVQQGGTYYVNWMGQGEKWLWSQSRNHWYFVLPDGRFYAWTGSTLQQSTLVGTLDVAVFANPTLLTSAPPPQAPAVGTSISGNQLTLTAPAGFAGTFRVTVSASDGYMSAAKSFVVTVIDQPPQLAALTDQSIAQGNSVQVALSATDPDHDGLTFQTVVQPYNHLWDLNQQLQFTKFNNTYCDNWLGQGEKWLRSNVDGSWYFILSSGALYRWGGAGLNTSTLIETLNSSVYLDPTLLYLAQLPTQPAASTSLSGNTLTVTPPAGYAGTFRVVVTVSDGTTSSSRSFLVTVH